jgi:hypothetical protein
MSNNLKDTLRPLLQTYTRDQPVACSRLARLPKGDLTKLEWIFAVGELDAAAVDVLNVSIGALTRQPTRGEIMTIVRVTKELDQIVASNRRL